MAYTWAHPLAVLPFRRFGFRLSALVAGSMAPDYEFVIRASATSRYGHTLEGMLLFAWPAGLAALWIYHRVLKHGVYSIMPCFVQARLEPLMTAQRPATWSRHVSDALAVLLGAMTHVIWDQPTHNTTWITEQCQPLQTSAFTVMGSVLTWADVLQIVTTVLGTLALAVILWRWFWSAPSFLLRPLASFSARSKIIAWGSLIGVPVMTVLLYLVFVVPLPCDLDTFIYHFGEMGGLGLCVGFYGLALFSFLVGRKTRPVETWLPETDDRGDQVKEVPGAHRHRNSVQT